MKEKGKLLSPTPGFFAWARWGHLSISCPISWKKPAQIWAQKHSEGWRILSLGRILEKALAIWYWMKDKWNPLTCLWFLGSYRFYFKRIKFRFGQNEEVSLFAVIDPKDPIDPRSRMHCYVFEKVKDPRSSVLRNTYLDLKKKNTKRLIIWLIGRVRNVVNHSCES